MMARELISIVIPVLNEAANLQRLVQRLTPVLDGLGMTWEMVFVDDGSMDDTLDKLRQLHTVDDRIKAVSLSRNFGKEIALAAGLRYARGDAAILMDADLQHPPELLAAAAGLTPLPRPAAWPSVMLRALVKLPGAPANSTTESSTPPET